MRSPVIAAATNPPAAGGATTANQYNSSRIAMNVATTAAATSTSNNNSNSSAAASTPSSSAQSHLDADPAMAPTTTKSNIGPNTTTSPGTMSTPILAQSTTMTPVDDSKPILNDAKPDANVTKQDGAPVIAQEINAATPLQSDQCEGSPREGFAPTSASLTSAHTTDPVQDEHNDVCEASGLSLPPQSSTTTATKTVNTDSIAVTPTSSSRIQSSSSVSATAVVAAPPSDVISIATPSIVPSSNTNNDQGTTTATTSLVNVGDEKSDTRTVLVQDDDNSNVSRPLTPNNSSQISNLNTRPLGIETSTAKDIATITTIDDSHESNASGYTSGITTTSTGNSPVGMMQSVAVAHVPMAVDVTSGIDNTTAKASLYTATTPTTSNPKFQNLSNPVVVKPNAQVVVNMKHDDDAPTKSNQIPVQSIESARKQSTLSSSGNPEMTSSAVPVQQLAGNKTSSTANSSSLSTTNNTDTSMTSANKLKGSVDSNINTSLPTSATSETAPSTKEAMQVVVSVPTSNKSEPEKKAAGRVRYVETSSPFSLSTAFTSHCPLTLKMLDLPCRRTASEMLDDQSTEEKTAEEDETVSRPSKRQAMLKSDIEAYCSPGAVTKSENSATGAFPAKRYVKGNFRLNCYSAVLRNAK